jgi:uncharacterized protein (TIGR02270 family)
MTTSIRTFNAGLYREHLDEAAFLYDQRHAYLHDPEVLWPDLRSWEDRLDAHVDALVLGGAQAAEICGRSVADGEPGAVYAALTVSCRQHRRAETFAALEALILEEDAVAQAAALALCQSAPSAWRTDLLQALERSRPLLTRVLARVAGYRRFASEAILQRKLTDASPAGRVEIAWALGRVGTTASVPALWALFEGDDERVRYAAALALMRLGHDGPLRRAMDEAWDHAWARRVLAIGGNREAARTLIAMAVDGRADVDTVLALGFLGHLPAVTPLLDLLEDDTLARPAAVALNTITGAQLQARVFVPEVFDRDELSDDERAAYEKDGTLPTRLGGEPYGNWERVSLRDKASWRVWLDDNRHRFSRELRWRFGMPYAPAALTACLRAEATPWAVRAAIYEELVVRYRLDVPFEIDLSVAQQLRSLERIDAWVAQQTRAVGAGEWYFAGAPQP